MTRFQMIASVWGDEIYRRWSNNEINLFQVVTYALSEGVDISDEQPDEILLDGVMGVAGGYILSYESQEDIINVWKQINS